MLSRAVLRSVRATALRPTRAHIGITSPSNQWMRGYAKDSKAKQKKPLTLGGQRPSDVLTGSKEAAQSSTPLSKQQSETSAASSEENTAPQKTSSSSQNDVNYSKQQPEFQTSASSAENTAPQSTSPSAIDPAEAQKQQQKQNLPDLRQGLPSTIDYELRSAASKGKGAKVSIMNLTEDPSTDDGGMGDIPASSYVSSADRKRQKLTNWAVMLTFGAILLSPVYLGRNWETEEEEKAHPDAPSGFSVKFFFQRIRARTNDWMGYYTEPAFTKLLPDITDASYGREYTLVLNLEDLLIHNGWTREHGWRLAKRPGLDYFLRYLQQYYELVIWTTQPFSIAEVVVSKLDPYHLCQPLFREATLYSNGEHIKVRGLFNKGS